MAIQEVSILLVEDNPADQELTIHALRRENLANNIHVVQDGAEALDFLYCRGPYSGRSIAFPPRLVLLDLKLPKVGGMEVLRQIKADARTKPIIVCVLTSSKEDPDLVECYRLGANSYIQKPVDIEQFREAVRIAGLYWLVVNERPPAKCFQTP